MEISWFGQTCFRIKGKTTAVVTDPFNENLAGLKRPPLDAQIVTLSHDEDQNYKSISGEPFVVKGPGEYEVKGVNIVGVSTGKNTIYNLEIDEIKVAHCGDLDQTLNNDQLEELGDVDILLIPVGGVDTIDAEKAAKLTAQIEPKIVIPMHYQSVEPFLKELGKENTQPVPKLIITKDKLPEELQIVVLEKS